MSLRLQTLGSPRVYLGGAEVADLPTQRLRFALLAFLAVEGEAPREVVLSLFWPDRDAGRARHALRQMLYELRQLLGEDWIDVGRDRIAVRAEVDAVAFERAATENRTADALALYGGPFLDGFALDNHGFEAWVDRQRAHLGRRYRRLSRDHITGLLERGETETALHIAQRWVDMDPLEDEASHALIHCLALTGQRLAALQYYESYERQLAAELQVEPLEETRALIERIRAGDPAAAPGGDVLLPGPVAPPAPASSPTDAPAGGSPANGAPDAAAAAAPAGPPAAVIGTGTPPAVPSADPSAGASPVRRGGRRWSRELVTAGIVAAIAIAVVAVSSKEPPAREGSATPTSRVLVIPFADRSGDSSLAAFADALTDELTRSLALSRPLQVVSGSGVAAMSQRGVPPDSVRRLLDADYVVTGNVSVAGTLVRVGVELLDGRSGSIIRGEVVERSRTESRVLADDVVDRTAGLLRREVGQHVAIRRMRSQTTSEEAWRHLVEAYAAQERLTRLIRHHDWDGFQRATELADSLLARAADLDRRWTEPLVRRGWIMERRAIVLSLSAPGDTAGRRKLFEAGRSMADRVLERDAREAQGYELRGAMLYQLAQLRSQRPDSASVWLAAAEKDLQRAAQLDPNSPAPWRRLAVLLSGTGRFAAAKNAAEKAWEIDRYVMEAGQVVNLLFSTSLELHEDAEAVRWCTEGRRSFPQQLPFIYCTFLLHAWSDGVPPDPSALRLELAHFDTMRVPQADFRPRLELLLAATYARVGQPDSARAILARLPPDAAPLWLRASVHTALSEPETAVNLLAEYLATSTEGFPNARSRAFRRLQGRPDYERLVTQ